MVIREENHEQAQAQPLQIQPDAVRPLAVQPLEFPVDAV